MKKIISLLFISLTLLFLTGCAPEIEKRIISTESVDENSEIITHEIEIDGHKGEMKDIKYNWNTEEFQNFFDERLRNALNWIKENTSEDSKILSWWDYGHMMRGYAHRDSVIYYPSKEILYTLANKGEGLPQDQLMPHNIIVEVAKALVSSGGDPLKDTMRKHDADYLFIAKQDHFLTNMLSEIANVEPAEDTILDLAVEGDSIEGLEYVYEDRHATIYRLLKNEN